MMKLKFIKVVIIFLLATIVTACNKKPLNDPYPGRDATANYYYASFNERPKTLDPARSYSANEYLFIAQIYEPPLQYHYLLRPYTLIPQTLTKMPEAINYDSTGQVVSADNPTTKIAYTIYTLHVKPGIYYQPHPAFAKDAKGNFLYHHLTEDQVDNYYSITDFKKTGMRELTAEDYAYQIKRLASPTTQSPIYGLMSNYIAGLTQLHDELEKKYKLLSNDKSDGVYLDLRPFNLSGVKVLDRYTYQIKINGQYPQFLYWLAMPFFAPMPWEADYFYSQAGMSDQNLTLDWYPVGTGAYQLKVNNPSRQIVLIKNPNFHGETYPAQGEAGDKRLGLLADAGKPLPFVDEFIFSLERESIPRWNKFLQGYYDSSSILSDSYDQAIKVDSAGELELSDELDSKGIRLRTSVSTSIWYLGFNMLDPVVGGYTESQQKLRQAISIAVDYDEYIAIFLNGRGIAAQGPIPPGIFGYLTGEEAIDPYVYRWTGDHPERLPIEQAKKLLAEAGFPDGRDAKTGEPLILNYDAVESSGPDDKAYFDWVRKQFAKLGIQLQIRSSTYNRFQEKVRTGGVQIFLSGWIADYPDPENFLFLLYGPNSKVKSGGENVSNYSNKEFDKIFDQLKNMPNTPQRATLINQALNLVKNDAPWVFGYYPKDFTLTQPWLNPLKPNDVANNTMKYVKLDPKLRANLRMAWNKPIFWPFLLVMGIFFLALLPVFIQYWRKEYRTKLRK